MEVDVTGMAEIQKMIANMGRKGKQVGKEATIKGAEYLKTQIQSNVPVDDGVFRDGIVVTEKGKNVIVHSGRVPHAHLVEFGRSGGSTKWTDKNGVQRTVKWGATSPNPVVARTYESQRQKVIEIIGADVKKRLGL